MAMNPEAKFPNAVNTAIVDIENADGTTAQDLVTGGADGTKVMQILATTDDSGDLALKVYKTDGTAVMPLGVVTVPDGSGTNGTDGFVDVLTGLGLSSVWLKDASWKVQVAVQSAVTADDTLWVAAEAQDY